MNIEKLDDGTLLALFRSRWADSIYSSHSTDGGRTWPYIKDIEVGDGYAMTNNSNEKLNREYSYPFIKQSPDGKIHIAFTYFRQAIKYVCISKEFIKA